jgi:hypothetical protein
MGQSDEGINNPKHVIQRQVILYCICVFEKCCVSADKLEYLVLAILLAALHSTGFEGLVEKHEENSTQKNFT